MKILFILILNISLFANQLVNIEAENFIADQNTLTTTFTTNIKIVKADDKIFADKVIVLFDKENTPIKYEATKNVKFSLLTKKSLIVGSCESLTYSPKSKNYTLQGSVKIDDPSLGRKISASKVIIDQVNGKTIITGQKKKPVKFIFDIKE